MSCPVSKKEEKQEGIPLQVNLLRGAMGWESGRVQKVSRRRLWQFVDSRRFVLGSVNYVELVDALGIYNAPEPYFS